MNDMQTFPDMHGATQFWDDVDLVSRHVLELTLRPPGDHSEMQSAVRERLRSEGHDIAIFTRRVLTYSHQLVEMELKRSDDKTGISPLHSWVLRTSDLANDSQIPQGHAMTGRSGRQIEERANEIFMESLTASWLTLYFVGLPFIHPWERVRRLADDCGGFPSGACTTKYIGDLYRLARQERARGIHTAPEDDVLVLSYAPSMLIPNLLSRDEANLTPLSAHVLGRCYALLQLRLYIRAGFPLTYYVTQQALRRNWRAMMPEGGHARMDFFAAMRDWLLLNVPTSAPGQHVRLLLGAVPPGMPTCVLSARAGMYIMDTSQHPVPFAGNYVRGSLQLSYREKLLGLKAKASAAPAGKVACVELLDQSKPEFTELMQGLADQD